MAELARLFESLLQRWINPSASVGQIVQLPEDAQDHSGATVHFYHVSYTTPASPQTMITLVTKDAMLYERQILAWLNDQHLPHIPLSYTDDLTTNASQLLCQEFAGKRVPLTPTHFQSVARALAHLHAHNCGDSRHLPWMRRLRGVGFGLWWRQAWQRAITNPDFVHEFRSYLPYIEPALARFVQTVEHLWREEACLTVLHTDLSPWHVLVRDDHPYLIDWDQARYGPLYLDLPNFFTLETVVLYYEALVARGLRLNYAEFLTRFHTTWCFVGLKYMVPYLDMWVEGERTASREWLHTLLPRAIAKQASP